MNDNPKHILFVMPHLAFGGAERVASHLAAYLRGQAHHPALVIARQYSWLPDLKEDWFDRVMETIVRIDAEPANWTAALLRHITELEASVLVLVGLSPVYHALPVIRRQCPGLRVVAFQFNERELTEEHRIYAAWLDLIIVEGRNLVDLLVDSGVDPDRIALIPSAIDRDKFLAREHAISATRAGSVGRRTAVGFVGRIDPAKDPLMFVEIATLLRSRPIDFIMAGDGPLESDVRKAIHRRRLERTVRYLGRVGYDLMPAVYATLDIVVVPSRIDGRPQVVQEAQAAGVPVIAADVGSIRDLIDNENTGLLCPAGCGASTYVGQITRLLADADLRRRLSEQGRRRIERSASLTATLELYTVALLGRMPDKSSELFLAAHSP